MKPRLNAAFKALRAEGIIARQNFSCCSSCAGYAITGIAVKRVQAGRSVHGVTFYHRQDTAGMFENGLLYIRYGNVDSTELGSIGLPPEEVGAIVCQKLTEAGLKWWWDGDPDECIVTYIGHPSVGS